MRSAIKLRRHFDRSIPIVGFALSIFGLIMILSSSQILAAERYDNSYYFFLRQLFAWFIGLGAFFYFSQIKLEKLFENRTKLLYVMLIGLALVFVPIIGPEIANVHRWINLGFFQFQPAELAKLLIIIFFSALFASRGMEIQDPKRGLLPFLVVLGLTSLLVVAEPDLGTAFIIIVVSMAIFFAARVDLLQFLALIVAGAVILLLLIYSAPYRVERFTSFISKVNDNADTLGSAYHTHQALIAVGSGGMWGLGFGQGTSKYAYLPQAHTDSIFAVIAEELGFVRASLTILAFLYLAWRGFLVAQRANSWFAKLLAVGVTVLFVSQALVNVSGILSLLPLTGVPLPFISYGGSSLIVSLAALGLLTNVSREVA